MPVDSLVEPFGGQMPILVAFVVSLVVLVAWLAFLCVAYRRRRKVQRGMTLGAFSGADRERWIASIRRIADTYVPVADQESLRTLHLELGQQMRAIVSERSGWDVLSWSVGDMRGHLALAEVTELLASWERPSFAPDPQAHAEESVSQALAVVSRW